MRVSLAFRLPTSDFRLSAKAVRMTSAELLLLLPEGVLAAGIVAAIITDLVVPPAQKRLVAWVGAAACVLALFASATAARGDAGSLQRIDVLAGLARPGVLLATALLLLAGTGIPGLRRGRSVGEWYVLLLALGFGALITASSASLLSLWLGLEVMSLTGYALAGWRDGDRRAAEAGMKYVLFGGVASGLTLFGISHVYGLTGSLAFADIGGALTGGAQPAVLAALALAGAGLAYKLALVPLHFYAPDVYQGAPAASVAALGVIPKIAAIAALVRALDLIAPPGSALTTAEQLGGILALLAVATLAVSALVALVQRDAKRILAFSAIGHAGAIVLAVACRPGGGALAAAAFYLAAYAAANIGAFLCLARLEADAGSADLDALTGAGRRRPWTVAALALFLFSLVGIPPLAGFLAKWAVLMQVVDVGLSQSGRGHLVWAGIALVVASAVSAFAYLKIFRATILAPPAGTAPAPVERCDPPLAAAIAVCALLSIGLGVALPWLPKLAGLLG
jgi:NADH-quinone oxidoreductase subunit N